MRCFNCGCKLDRDYVICPNCYMNLKEVYDGMISEYEHKVLVKAIDVL